MSALGIDASEANWRRSSRGMILLWIGPGSWIIQLLVNYALTSHSCYPDGSPLADQPPAWDFVWSGLLIFNLAALATALAAGAVALSRRPRSLGGPSRFLATSGAMTNLGFAVAILFEIAALFVVPSCGS